MGKSNTEGLVGVSLRCRDCNCLRLPSRARVMARLHLLLPFPRRRNNVSPTQDPTPATTPPTCVSTLSLF